MITTKQPLENAKVGVQVDDSLLFGKKAELSSNNNEESSRRFNEIQEDSIGRLANPAEV